jgi:hypothetical protein
MPQFPAMAPDTGITFAGSQRVIQTIQTKGSAQ